MSSCAAVAALPLSRQLVVQMVQLVHMYINFPPKNLGIMVQLVCTKIVPKKGLLVEHPAKRIRLLDFSIYPFLIGFSEK